MKKIIIEGNAVYKIDEECIKKKEEKEKKGKKEAKPKEKGCR